MRGEVGRGMNGLEMAAHLRSNGYAVTSRAALDGSEARAALRAFMQREREYRERFLQSAYGSGFDGYSYYGQEDSSHQAEDDLISTYVTSEFYGVERYPAELQAFLRTGWKEVLEAVRALEVELIAGLEIAGLAAFYREHVGHMMSHNYYPPIEQFRTAAAGNTRLSAHPDVSMFTVFPFGIDRELELEAPDGAGARAWRTVDASDSILIYPGYLMEMWTEGAIRAMNHRVRLGADRTAERCSFSVFSLPFPGRRFEMPGRGAMSSEAYFEAYGALF